MPTVSYGRILSFLDQWEAALNNLEEVFFAPSFDNLIKLSLSQLEPKKATIVARNAAGYRWDLLRTIGDHLQRRNIIVGIIRLEAKSELDDLKNELLKSQFNMAKIFPLLQKVASSPSDNLLRTEITKWLLSTQKPNNDRLSALVQLLLRQIATRFSVSELKLLPKQVLAQQHVKYLIPACVEALAADPDIDLVRTYILDKIFLATAKDPDSATPFEVQGTEQALLLMILGLPDLLFDRISRVRTATRQVDPIERLLLDPAALEPMGLQMMQGYLTAMVAGLFRAIGWAEVLSDECRLGIVSGMIGDHIIRVASLEDNRQPTAPRPVVQDIISKHALVKSVAELLSERCLANYQPEQWRLLARELATLVLTSVHDAAIQRNMNWSESSDDQTKRFFWDCSAQRSLHSGITQLLQPLRAFAQNEISTMTWASVAPLSSGEAQHFWEQWGASFEASVLSHHSIFDYLPWASLAVTEFRICMGELFQQLFRPESDFMVILRVNSIDPQRMIWSTGNMTFYDPTMFNYGEDQRSSGPFLRTEHEQNVVGLALFVKAYSDFDAQQRAILNSKDALHVLSFAFSVGKQAGGFQPQMARGIATYRIMQSHWSWLWHRKRAEMSDVLLAETDNVMTMAREYDRIVTRSTQSSTYLSDLQQGLLNSLHWYVRGRWNPDPIDRFLFHWIGLEHLFVGGHPSKEKLFDSLPRLYRTWWELKSTISLRKGLVRVRAALEGDAHLSRMADQEVALRGWRIDNRVFMKPRKMPVLARIFKYAEPSVQAQLSEFEVELRTALARRRKLRTAIRTNRDAAQVELRLLYEWRNQMAHEAAAYQPGMEYYANKIERILENILRKVAGEALVVNGTCKTVVDLIDLYKGPLT
jgi:hypothetical protein